jgi:hypothetical protein
MAEDRPPTLSILIVSYNTRAMTLACLDSIAAGAELTAHEIIVVDNASSDGSAEAIASHPAAPRLIASVENLGFARANAEAARWARGELLLLLNPDTVVLKGAIDRLVDFARLRPKAQIWGGRTLFADGRLNPASAWGRMTLWRLFCRASGLTGIFPGSRLFDGEAIGGWQRDSEREVDIVSGAFLMLPSALWDRLGGFDPLFFMYGEEADLSLRARRLGARPRVTPEATIIHHGGASERTREGKMVRLLAAKATLIRRHFPRWARLPGLALHAAWPLSRAAALGVAGWVGSNAEHREAARVWWTIWRRRAEWIGGYEPARPAPDRVLSSVGSRP